ncbi:MAG: manganese efflux pump [Oscillospiraceae bacterium]|nr:manganese efflux pump [Oscillospiraceae bacterium]
MGFTALFVLAIGVSMDAFAVSICKGLAMQKADLKGMITVGGWFGGFQALMPLIGFYLGTLFAEAIESVDHWVAFGLLGLLGVNMLKEAFSSECDCCCEDHNADLSVKTMFVMAVATSIDALAVGISLAMAGGVNIWLSIALIGLTTFTTSAFGVKLGSVFGGAFEKKAQIAGGLILIGLGLKILLEHLGVLA